MTTLTYADCQHWYICPYQEGTLELESEYVSTRQRGRERGTVS